MGMWVSSPGGLAPRAWVRPVTSSSADTKNAWSYTPAPHASSWRGDNANPNLVWAWWSVSTSVRLRFSSMRTELRRFFMCFCTCSKRQHNGWDVGVRLMIDSQGTRCRAVLTYASINQVKEILETNMGPFRFLSFWQMQTGTGNLRLIIAYSFRKLNVFEN